MNINPYPYNYKKTNNTLEINKNFEKMDGKETSVAGRIINIRKMGGIYFIDLLDSEGKLQVIFKKDESSEDTLKIIELCDVADIIGVKGIITKTSRGEISIKLNEVEILAKSLRRHIFNSTFRRKHNLTGTCMVCNTRIRIIFNRIYSF